jgi:hypothetical protein
MIISKVPVPAAFEALNYFHATFELVCLVLSLTLEGLSFCAQTLTKPDDYTMTGVSQVGDLIRKQISRRNIYNILPGKRKIYPA